MIILDSAVRNGKECQGFDSESVAARLVARADIPVQVDDRATSDSGSKGWCYLPFPTAESRIIDLLAKAFFRGPRNLFMKTCAIFSTQISGKGTQESQRSEMKTYIERVIYECQYVRPYPMSVCQA